MDPIPCSDLESGLSDISEGDLNTDIDSECETQPLEQNPHKAKDNHETYHETEEEEFDSDVPEDNSNKSADDPQSEKNITEESPVEGQQDQNVPANLEPFGEPESTGTERLGHGNPEEMELDAGMMTNEVENEDAQNLDQAEVDTEAMPRQIEEETSHEIEQLTTNEKFTEEREPQEPTVTENNVSADKVALDSEPSNIVPSAGINNDQETQEEEDVTMNAPNDEAENSQRPTEEAQAHLESEDLLLDFQLSESGEEETAQNEETQGEITEDHEVSNIQQTTTDKGEESPQENEEETEEDPDSNRATENEIILVEEQLNPQMEENDQETLHDTLYEENDQSYNGSVIGDLDAISRVDAVSWKSDNEQMETLALEDSEHESGNESEEDESDRDDENDSDDGKAESNSKAETVTPSRYKMAAIKCYQCGIKSNGLESLKRHLTQHFIGRILDTLESEQKVCKVCDTKFNNRLNLSVHLSVAHNWIKDYVERSEQPEIFEDQD